jgi:hypothetical protein
MKRAGTNKIYKVEKLICEFHPAFKKQDIHG